MKVLKALATPFTALAGSANHTVEQKIIMSVVRHVATALGAILVAHGVVDASQSTEVVGALVTLLGALSGAAQKIIEHGL